jgi:hypothetical protein
MVGAVALGGVAVFLVVVGHSQKQVQIGLLFGLWGVLLGAFTLFGPRRAALDADPEALGSGLDRLPAQRREDDLKLEATVRREMERVLRDELSQLRGEVAGLRNDLVENVSGSLVEKVSGQLRLERIETTRVISSDIDELQHEVRRLAVARSSAPPALDGATFSPATVVESRVKNSAPLPYVYANPHNRDRPAPARPAPSPSAASAAPAGSAAPARTPHPPATPSGVPARASQPPARPAPTPQPALAPARSAPSSAGQRPAGAQPSTRPSPPPLSDVPEITVPRSYSSPFSAAAYSMPTSTSSEPPAPPAPAPPASAPPAPAAFEMPRPAPQPARSLPPEPDPFGPPTPFEGRPLAPEPARSLSPTPNLPPPPAPPSPAPPSPAPPTSAAVAPAASPLEALRASIAQQQQRAAAPTSAQPGDPLVGMPRLSRFDYEWDEPGERRAPPLVWDFDHVGPASRPLAPPAPSPVVPAPSVEPRPAQPYVGRRRSSGEPDPRYPSAGPPSAANETSNGGGHYDDSRRTPYSPPFNGVYGSANGNVSHGNGANGNGANGNGANGNGTHGNGTHGNGASAYGSSNGTSPYGATNGAPGPNGHSTNGTHSNSVAAPANGHAAPAPAVGGRRRRAEGEVDDVLARLLGR